MIRECCMSLLLGGSLAAAASGQTADELLAKHAQYLGERKLDGTPVHQLELPDTEDGEATKVFLDAKSFLERGEERFWSAHGQSVQYVTVYSDFRQAEGLTQGLTLPYRIEIRFKETQGHGMTAITGGQVLAIDKIEVNVDLPEIRFARPKANAAKTP